VKETTGLYPRLRVDAAGSGVVSQAGGLLLTEAVRISGLDRELSRALAPWRKPLAVHDPAKIVTDLAITLALGGDCLADIAVLRAAPELFGRVASDPTVSRTVDALAQDAPRALKAINAARAAARTRVWALAGEHAPDADTNAENPLIMDADATLVTAHSDKQGAAPTFKRGYGFHPLWVFVDHGPDGTGEPLAVLLRPGNAGSNTAADHISVVGDALKQLPGHRPGTRPGRKVLIRTDAAGATHDFLNWVVSQRMSYSVGFTLPDNFAEILPRIPKQAWTPAIDADGEPRDGAWVADVTGLLDLSNWPKGMRVIVRKERPHPGAQLRLTDVDGHRITAFATSTPRGQLADLELRHRRRARAEDRIRCAKDTGLTNLPLHDLTQNQIWCAIVTLACELTTWMQTLAFTTATETSKTETDQTETGATGQGGHDRHNGHEARRWEPKRLRLRLFSTAARIARTGRRIVVHLAHSDWTDLLLAGITKLRALATPG
jgi:Transposase DDE domain group 1